MSSYLYVSDFQGLNKFMLHYLMLKEHLVTGLKYLCKTSTTNPKRPYYYVGSGIYWKKHLKKHGRKIKTTILKICTTKEDLIKTGIEYSRKWDVVRNEQFANLVEERGDGGPNFLGGKLSEEGKKKKSKSLKLFWSLASQEYKNKRNKINKESHKEFIYYTPKGIFSNSFDAAKANNCTNVTVIVRCKNNKTPIQSKRYWKYGWRGKTWEELGWYRKNFKP